MSENLELTQNKYISYSVWGNNPKYTIGAIKNAELALDLYPGWKSRFYVGRSIPDDILLRLMSIPNTEIISEWMSPEDWTGMFWRFKASYDKNVDVVIFRDTDSRLNQRECDAVNAWLSSNKTFHIMRDHPFHKFFILGGMWGYKNNSLHDMYLILNRFQAKNTYGTDYKFFKEVLYDIIGDDKMVHDEFFDRKPFPSPRDGNHFVGEVFDEHDNRHPEHYKILEQHIKSK